MRGTTIAAILILAATAAAAQQTTPPQEAPAAEAAATPEGDDAARAAETEAVAEEERDRGPTFFGIPLNGFIVVQGRRSHAELRNSRSFSASRHYDRDFFTDR